MESKFLQHLVSLRRYLHMNPEPGFEEVNTRGALEKELLAIGVPSSSITYAAKTGMFVDIQGECAHSGTVGEQYLQPASDAQGKRIIAIRTDLDCLRMTEANQTLPYRSKHEGCAHMCGHDGHMTALIGTAHLIWQAREKIPRNCVVRLLCQPAEEGPGGAPLMIDDGCLDGVAEVYGWHNWSTFPFEHVRVTSGATMAHVALFSVTITGKGGHASQPQICTDPVVATAQIITALQSIVSRNVHYHQPAVVSVCKVTAGESRNVIPDTSVFEGTIRDVNEDTYKLIVERFKTIVHSTSEAFGCTAEIHIENLYPALCNTANEADHVERVAKSLLGEANVSAADLPMTGAEDFAYYLRGPKGRPGCFFFVGTGEQESQDANAWHTCAGMHASDFDFNDRVLNLIITLFVRIIENRLGIELYHGSGVDGSNAKLLMCREDALKAVKSCGDIAGTYTPGGPSTM